MASYSDSFQRQAGSAVLPLSADLFRDYSLNATREMLDFVNQDVGVSQYDVIFGLAGGYTNDWQFELPAQLTDVIRKQPGTEGLSPTVLSKVLDFSSAPVEDSDDFKFNLDWPHFKRHGAVIWLFPANMPKSLDLNFVISVGGYEVASRVPGYFAFIPKGVGGYGPFHASRYFDHRALLFTDTFHAFLYYLGLCSRPRCLVTSVETDEIELPAHVIRRGSRKNSFVIARSSQRNNNAICVVYECEQSWSQLGIGELISRFGGS